jgi:CrcB protein
VGEFALGFLMVFVLDVWPSHRHLRPFLAVGVLGGYTTFSTYMLDSRTLLADGHVLSAFAYVVGSLLLGLLAVSGGVLLARLLVQRAERGRRRRRRRSSRDLDIDRDDPTTRSTR